MHAGEQHPAGTQRRVGKGDGGEGRGLFGGGREGGGRRANREVRGGADGTSKLILARFQNQADCWHICTSIRKIQAASTRGEPS